MVEKHNGFDISIGTSFKDLVSEISNETSLEVLVWGSRFGISIGREVGHFSSGAECHLALDSSHGGKV